MIDPQTTANSPSIPWGYRFCPNCSSAMQVKPKSVRFFARYEGDAILFMLCDHCAKRYDQSSQKNRQIFQDECLQLIRSSSLPACMWANTTHLAIAMNFGDFAAAVEYGIHGIDRTTYEALIRADEARLFVNGAPIPWQPFPQKAASQDASHPNPSKLNEGCSK